MFNCQFHLLPTHTQVIPGVEVTVGSDEDPAAQAINTMGGKHSTKQVTVSSIDPTTKTMTCCKFIVCSPTPLDPPPLDPPPLDPTPLDPPPYFP